MTYGLGAKPGLAHWCHHHVLCNLPAPQLCQQSAYELVTGRLPLLPRGFIFSTMLIISQGATCSYVLSIPIPGGKLRGRGSYLWCPPWYFQGRVGHSAGGKS